MLQINEIRDILVRGCSWSFATKSCQLGPRSSGVPVKFVRRQMKKRLTERLVQTVAPPAAGRLVFADAIAPGLELRVSVDGRRSWSIRYRLKGGTRQRATYGSYPAKSLAEARARALAIAAAAADGINLPAKEEAERDEQRKGEGRPRTVGALVDDYVARHCKVTQRRPLMVERLFENHVKPAIGDLLLTDLRRAELVELLD